MLILEYEAKKIPLILYYYTKIKIIDFIIFEKNLTKKYNSFLKLYQDIYNLK